MFGELVALDIEYRISAGCIGGDFNRGKILQFKCTMAI